MSVTKAQESADLSLSFKEQKIEDVADVNPRIDKSAISEDLLVSFVPMPAVGPGDGSINVQETRPAGEVKKGFTSFLEGDVLFAKITPCMENGKMAVVPRLVNDYGFGSTEFHVLRPKPGMGAKYLYYYVSSRSFRSEAERYMTGAVGQRRVPTTYLKEAKIPVAPPAQQKQIVAEIEKQFSRLDEAVANLKRIKANLKRYKAAVLKAAVEGKLTEDWRKEHLPAPTSRPGKFYTYAILCKDASIYIGHTDDIERRWNEHLEGKGAEWTKDHKPVKIAHYEEFDSRQEAADREKWLKTGFGRKWIKRELAAGRTRQAGQIEPATKLLARILTARRENWTGRGKYKDPNSRINADLPTLPSSWVWVSLDQLFLNITDGDHQPPPQTDSGVPFLVIGNVRSGKLNFEDTRFVSQDYADAVDSFRKPTQGDILYTLVGSFGIALQVDTDREFCIQRHIGILRPHKLSPTSYLVHILNSSFVFSQAAKVATGTAQKTVPLAGLRRFSIPLAPQAEQQQIVIEVERHLSVIEKLEASVIASLIRADRLRQSILQQAFSGRLKMTEFASNLDISSPTIVAPIAAPDSLSEEILMNKRPTTSSGAIRPILDVLQETGEPVAPEKLFSLCGLDSTSIEQVEGFYAELNSLVDANKVEEFRLSVDSVTLRARG